MNYWSVLMPKDIDSDMVCAK